jgi:hypothetical protein
MNNLDATLLEGIAAIEPYLDRLVIAGGWVPYIYKKMYGSLASRDPLITQDIDVVISSHGFSDEVPTLDKTILAAGFAHDFASLTDPPVVNRHRPSSNPASSNCFLGDGRRSIQAILSICNGRVNQHNVPRLRNAAACQGHC